MDHQRQVEFAHAFRGLHQPGAPLIIYNAWDAGSAQAIARAGAKAIATGSDSVAAAQGYPDGEQIPFDFVLRIAGRIAASVDLPVSIDIEGGYAEDPRDIKMHTEQLLDIGVVGLNFEDGHPKEEGAGLHGLDVQASRIAAIRGGADARSVPLFINARCDLFLQAEDTASHPSLLQEAIARARAYANAGADGFFVPLLTDLTLIEQLADAVPLPINVMAIPGGPTAKAFAGAGASRISHGPFPYRETLEGLERRATEVLASM